MSKIYLAYGGGPRTTIKAFRRYPNARLPALLVSRPYYRQFGRLNLHYAYREWVLDSGAYTNYQSGKPSDLAGYIDFCKKIGGEVAMPPRHIFALDAIGDWRETVRNTERMWKHGIEAVPTFHAGEPWDCLKGLAADYPFIAIGGAAGRLFGAERSDYMSEVFSHVWPKPMHAFGITTMDILEEFPFYSADSSTWISAPRWGRWLSRRDTRGSSLYSVQQKFAKTNVLNLRAEIDFFLDWEDKLRSRWSKELAQFEVAK